MTWWYCTLIHILTGSPLLLTFVRLVRRTSLIAKRRWPHCQDMYLTQKNRAQALQVHYRNQQTVTKIFSENPLFTCWPNLTKFGPNWPNLVQIGRFWPNFWSKSVNFLLISADFRPFSKNPLYFFLLPFVDYGSSACVQKPSYVPFKNISHITFRYRSCKSMLSYAYTTV